MKIFFDLDGTLIDSKQRLYLLFQELIPGSRLSFDEYWSYKQNKISHKQILKDIFRYSPEAITIFEKEWMDQIELEKWLSLDKPFSGVTEYLLTQRELHQLYVVTSRQFKRGVNWQFQQFGWMEIFQKIFVTEQMKEKYELIKEQVTVNSEDWFVGDTGKDIETGKQLNMKTAAVLSGFLSQPKLAEYQPDIIVNSVLDLVFKNDN